MFRSIRNKTEQFIIAHLERKIQMQQKNGGKPDENFHEQLHPEPRIHPGGSPRLHWRSEESGEDAHTEEAG
jgi:hypothetical protein